MCAPWQEYTRDFHPRAANVKAFRTPRPFADMAPMGTPDKRAHERLLCAGLVEVRWSDKDGYPCETIANLENLSSGGACLSIDCPIPPGTRVAEGHFISPG